MLFLIHLILLALFGFLVFRWVRFDVPAWLFLVAYLLKILAGLTVGYIFHEIYQGGDTIRFFELAQAEELVPENQPRTQFFVALISPIAYASGNSYWITAAWLSAAGFLGWYFVSRTLTGLFPETKNLILFSFLILPSAMFWSSGILKGTIALPAFGIAIALVIKLRKLQHLNWKEYLLLILSGYLLFEIKHYLFITAILFAGSLAVTLALRKISGIKRWAMLAAIIFITLTSTQIVHPYLRFSRIPLTLYENNQTILTRSKEENRLNIIIENPSWKAILSELPSSLYAGLLRPTILDKTIKLGIIHKIENFILCALMFSSLMLYLYQSPTIDKPLIVSGLACILMLALLLPLAAPNLGTLVRYKTAYIPYLFLISSILPYRYFIRNQSKND